MKLSKINSPIFVGSGVLEVELLKVEDVSSNVVLKSMDASVKLVGEVSLSNGDALSSATVEILVPIKMVENTCLVFTVHHTLISTV